MLKLVIATLILLIVSFFLISFKVFLSSGEKFEKHCTCGKYQGKSCNSICDR